MNSDYFPTNEIKNADINKDEEKLSSRKFSENRNSNHSISRSEDTKSDDIKIRGGLRVAEIVNLFNRSYEPNIGKSVEDITREMNHMISISDRNEINGILDVVSKKLKRPGSNYWRKPNVVELRKTLTNNPSDYEPCIVDICHAVKRVKGYWPRSTQLVSFCLLIKSFQGGRLLEIKTGEGKSCIVAMFAVFLALSGRSVDIVTSSPILAVRDCDEWRDFYKQFKLEVGSNLIPKENEDRLKCYKKTVVYGTVGSFASDILRQEFLMEDVRGARKFDAVIVDEVDSMLLDQGVNFTYLSSPAPGMHHIQPILLMIWNEVIRHPVVRSNLDRNYFVGKPEPLHVVLSKVLTELSNPLEILDLLEQNGVLRKGFTEVLMHQTETSFFRNEMTKEKMLECLRWAESNYDISVEVFEMYDGSTIHKVNKDADGKQAHLQLLIVGEGLVCVLYQDKKTLCELIKTKIERFLTTGCQDEGECRYEFPSYLLEFVYNRLPKWIDNAFIAISMKEGREYLIKDREIVPVDFESTGVVELDTKWGDGLHQFLELKHQKKLSQMTLVTNFMSNQAFFKRYPGKLFGLSGTLGSESELAFLDRYYGLNCLRIPTHRRQKFEEISGIVCPNKAEWLECIGKKVEEHTSSALHGNKRAVLIICEDINTAKEIEDSLKTQKCGPVTMFTENSEKERIERKTFAGGDVIVATNIAGRGTDIEIEKSVEKAGGLFVLVAFLPVNTRVENQVFGRCARKGQPGSAQIVINKESLSLYLQEFSNVQQLKGIRDDIEQQRIKDIENTLLSDANWKEDLFSFYCLFVRTVTELDCKDENEKSILLGSLHEFWGLWFKMNCDDLKDVKNDTIKVLQRQLDGALQEAKRRVMDRTSPCANLYHIINLANEQMINKNFTEAKKLFTKAIEIDGKWAAIAYYNRAYCSLQQQKGGYMEAAISDLNKAKEGLRKYKDEVILSISLLSILPKDTKSADESTTTTSQFDTRGQILNFYEENIEKALEKLAELKKEKKDAKAVGHNTLTIALGDNKFCKKLDSELYVFWDLGLTEIVSIEEKCGFNWKAALVVLLGVIQIAVGTVIITSTTGLLTKVGWGLVTEGINDICTGAFAFYQEDQNFVKSWAIGKAASIAISITTFGFNEIKLAAKEAKGLKATACAIQDKVTSGTKNLLKNVKDMPKTISSQVLKSNSKSVAAYTSKKLAIRGSKYVFESVNQHLKTYFENETRKKLKEEVSIAISNGKLKDALEKFIFIHSRKGQTQQEISDAFTNITKDLLSSDNIAEIRQILLACVKYLTNKAKQIMEKENKELFETCKMLFGCIEACQTQSYDVKNIIDIYYKHLNEALEEIYKDEYTKGNMNDNEQMKKEIQIFSENFLGERIVDHLFTLIQNSFDCTVSGIMTERLQKEVTECVSNILQEQGYRKDGIMQELLNISKKTATIATKKKLQLAVGATLQGIQAIQSGDSQVVMDTAFKVTKEGVDALVDDEATKKKVQFAVGATQQGIQAIQSGDSQVVMNTAFNVTKEGVDALVDDEATKKKVQFVVGATQQGIQAIQSGDSQVVMDTAFNVTKEGVDTLVDDDATKKKAQFAVGATQQGIQAIQSGDSQVMMDTAFKVTKEGVDTLVDDEATKKKAQFAVGATQQGIQAIQSGDSQVMMDHCFPGNQGRSRHAGR